MVLRNAAQKNTNSEPAQTAEKEPCWLISNLCDYIFNAPLHKSFTTISKQVFQKKVSKIKLNQRVWNRFYIVCIEI